MLGLHGKVSLAQSVNWSKAKAFTTIRSTGEGVSINLAGRDPDGIVDPADFEKVRDQVMDALSSFVDPKTGRKPVKAIYKREEIFKGKYADTAPDILLEPAEQYSLTHAKTALEDADWISGDPRIEGVNVAAGPNVKPSEQPLLLISDCLQRRRWARSSTSGRGLTRSARGSMRSARSDTRIDTLDAKMDAGFARMDARSMRSRRGWTRISNHTRGREPQIEPNLPRLARRVRSALRMEDEPRRLRDRGPGNREAAGPFGI